MHRSNCENQTHVVHIFWKVEFWANAQATHIATLVLFRRSSLRYPWNSFLNNNFFWGGWGFLAHHVPRGISSTYLIRLGERNYYLIRLGERKSDTKSASNKPTNFTNLNESWLTDWLGSKHQRAMRRQVYWEHINLSMQRLGIGTILSVERVSSIIYVPVDLCSRNWPK